MRTSDIDKIHATAKELLEFYETDDFKIGISEFAILSKLAFKINDSLLLIKMCKKSLFFESCKPALIALVERTLISNDDVLFSTIVQEMGAFIIFPILFTLDIANDVFQYYILKLIELDFKGVLLCVVESNADGNEFYSVCDMLISPFTNDIDAFNDILNALVDNLTYKTPFATTLIKFVIYCIPKFSVQATSSKFNEHLLRNYPTVDIHYCSILYQLVLKDKNSDFTEFTNEKELILLYLMVKHTLDISILKSLFPNAYIYVLSLLLNKFAIEQNPKYIQLLIQVFEQVDISMECDVSDFTSTLLESMVSVIEFTDLFEILKEMLLFCKSLITDLNVKCTVIIKDNFDYLSSKLEMESLEMTDLEEIKENNENIISFITDKEPSMIGYGLHLIHMYSNALYPVVLQLLNHSDPFVIQSTIQCILRMSHSNLFKVTEYITQDKNATQSISYLLNLCELINKLILRNGENIFQTNLIEVPLRILTQFKPNNSLYARIALTKHEMTKIDEELDQQDALELSQNVLRGSCLSIIQYSMKYAIKSTLPYLQDVVTSCCRLLANTNIFEARAISLIFAEMVMSTAISDATLITIIDKNTSIHMINAIKQCQVDDLVFNKNCNLVLEGLDRLDFGVESPKSILHFVK